MRIIEYISFCFADNKQKKISVSPIMIDATDISSFQHVNTFTCILNTKTQHHFTILGRYPQITNRWLYSLNKKHHFLEDKLLRPSQRITYDISNFAFDNIYMDEFQCLGFLHFYNALDKADKLEEFTQQKIKDALNFVLPI